MLNKNHPLATIIGDGSGRTPDKDRSNQTIDDNFVAPRNKCGETALTDTPTDIWLPGYNLPFVSNVQELCDKNRLTRDMLKHMELLTEQVTQIQQRQPRNLAEIKILDPRLGTIFPLPKYESHEAAGFDLRAMCVIKGTDIIPIDIYNPIYIGPEQTVMIGAGFSVNIDDPSVALMLYPRSGLGGMSGIVLGNLTGVLDSDYQGQVIMILWNRNTLGSTRPHIISAGDRVAQAVFTSVQQRQFKVVETFGRATERGEGGIGSTGVI